MHLQGAIEYDQILDLVYHLPKEEKKRLILDLQKYFINKNERVFGKYEGKGWISEDFNEPLDDFHEYMP